ncbi:hypothetical protein WA026_015344 [Henosepilachna vigintioctopunctata]|uniref:Inorganic phosphate cotransporter n=1 Tax=Henosepilachna vigintioctopunctata TaxID=420089 RepID=A0AAW1UFF9_9CUCU
MSFPPPEIQIPRPFPLPACIHGTVVSNLGGGYLIHVTEYWSSVFYLFGGLGLLWFIIFVLICYSSPDVHPFISDDEKSFLKQEIDNVSATRPPIPWGAIATSLPVWALIFAQIGHDWGFYTMVTDLPTYFRDVLKFNIAENGVWSSIPYVFMWLISLTSGYICDLCVIKGYMSVTFSRKFFTAVAKVGPAFFIIGASYSGCNRIAAICMFTIGMGFMGTYYCGMKVNGLDLCPNFAGTLMGVVNGIGAITGILSPYVAGAVTKNHTLLEWRTVFWITFGNFMVTNIIYILFGSAEEQWWNKPQVREDAGDQEGMDPTTTKPKRKWNIFSKKPND